MKKICFRKQYCLGCGLCQLHCIAAHSKYRHDLIRTFKRDQNRPLSRIVIEQNGADYSAVFCRQCEEPACVLVCSAGAISKNKENGVVFIDRERCVGCWMCLAACPFRAISSERKESKIAVKCDLCAGVPACVENCPNAALFCEDF